VRNSDRSWEAFIIKVNDSNNESISKLVSQSIAIQRQQYPDFHLIKSNTISFKGNSGYVVKYQYQDKLFGKALVMDIVMLKAGKVYWLSYIAELTKFYSYMPTIQRMIHSFVVEGQSSNGTRTLLSNLDILV